MASAVVARKAELIVTTREAELAVTASEVGPTNNVGELGLVVTTYSSRSRKRRSIRGR